MSGQSQKTPQASVARIILAVCTLVSLAILASGYTPFGRTATASVSECTASSDFTCWKARLQTLVKKDGVTVATADLKKYYQQIAFVKSNCHQLTHVIGREAALKYGDVATVFAHGDGFCWSGYYHGVMEAVAAKTGYNQIASQADSICAPLRKSRPYSFDHYNCVHGLGHGFMSIRSNRLFESLKDCDRLSDPWEKTSCYGGVYMENVMADINPGAHTDYLRPNEPMFPCTAVGESYKLQCYLMQTSYALKVSGYDFAKVFQECADLVDSAYITTCYESLGRDASGSTVSDSNRTKELCLLGSNSEAREHCVIGAVKDFISFFHGDTQAKAFCNGLGDGELTQSCLSTADSYTKTL